MPTVDMLSRRQRYQCLHPRMVNVHTARIQQCAVHDILHVDFRARKYQELSTTEALRA